MTRKELFEKLFELEFCEPDQKAQREKELNELYQKACTETNRPLYVLKPAILKCYRHYRAERLRKELPMIPPSSRDQ